MLEVERLAAGLREETGRIADIVGGADPDLRVPTCPEWTVRDLVEHIGNAHRWTADLVERRLTEPPALDLAPAPSPAAEDWPGWLREGAALVLDAARRTGTETTVWTFAGPRPASFWIRRMLHDTLVHRADAAVALGVEVDYAPDLAADTLTEGLELLCLPLAAQARPAIAELRGTGERLLLSPADLDEPGWLITRAPEGVTWERGDGPADVTLTGPVTDLVLVFTRRLPPDRARTEITGDTALLDHWLARTAF
ncbi:maleylpyruvate isomerase family mycothiol-dependent enzyme [Thermomonospora cellulosilytica]|uniref:Uncharacterized protein (TIGR03083 family) n=1 Tax=Thermomonospora cellulosilytica TaxID=1411118 RepID=A0A7W3RC03_9ACTN|nr:maleylpyruvate isomerase family mycothiol-dependent enzyme [Thermomonospora cellulosilytica]MBA9007562.1 uncharacterized protein (TIGR03083 family) [Thermomonospora cellulosilytica]